MGLNGLPWALEPLTAPNLYGEGDLILGGDHAPPFPVLCFVELQLKRDLAVVSPLIFAYVPSPRTIRQIGSRLPTARATGPDRRFHVSPFGLRPEVSHG